MIKKIKKTYKAMGQYMGAAFAAPSKIQGLSMCFLAGLGIILVGTQDASFATTSRYNINYNDQRIDTVINAIFTYLEGSFGALVMVAAGIGAIVSSAFGQYRAALGLLVVAIGAFVLRSLVGTFFNDKGIA
ncbi:MAG: hypothetical protein KDD70_15085 [Bdellovibrionales bacterium]|nr:hypothetical protein [Bdellovibrionales bacterium]